MYYFFNRVEFFWNFIPLFWWSISGFEPIWSSHCKCDGHPQQPHTPLFSSKFIYTYLAFGGGFEPCFIHTFTCIKYEHHIFAFVTMGLEIPSHSTVPDRTKTKLAGPSLRYRLSGPNAFLYWLIIKKLLSQTSQDLNLSSPFTRGVLSKLHYIRPWFGARTSRHDHVPSQPISSSLVVLMKLVE